MILSLLLNECCVDEISEQLILRASAITLPDLGSVSNVRWGMSTRESGKPHADKSGQGEG